METRIIQLIYRERIGSLNPEEKAELARALLTDQEASKMRDHLLQISEEKVIKYFDDIQQSNLESAWRTIAAKSKEKERLLKRGRKRKVWQLVSASAAAVVLFAIVRLHILSSTPMAPKVPDAASILGPKLTLANGSVYALEETTSTGKLFYDHNVKLNGRVLNFEDVTHEASMSGWNKVEVPTTHDYIIVLPDGTKVSLNSETSLRFPLSFSRTREVYLDKGEAFFEVAKDSKIPFFVNTPRGKISVLGTSFNINLYSLEKEVTSLVDGKIKINSAGGDSTMLNPGYEAILTSGKIQQTVSFDRLTTLGWLEGVNYFKDATIYEISDALKRWYNINIKIDDIDLTKVRLRGKLTKNVTIEKFISDMNATQVIHFYWREEVLHCRLGEYPKNNNGL